MAQRDVLAVGILISLCGSGMGWWGAWVPPFVLMPRGRAQVGFIPQGWAAAVFQVMEKQVFPSFLSKNTCLELGICSQTQEKTDLGLPRAGGHQEALSGCQRAGAPGAYSPALGAPRHGWGWGAGVNSSTRRTRGPGAQSLVSERPKRGCPGDSMYVRGTQDRAWAQRVWLGCACAWCTWKGSYEDAHYKCLALASSGSPSVQPPHRLRTRPAAWPWGPEVSRVPPCLISALASSWEMLAWTPLAVRGQACVRAGWALARVSSGVLAPESRGPHES